MSFIDSVFGTKPTPTQPQENVDVQQQKRLAAVEADKLKRADELRRRELNARLADEDRARLTAKRDAIVNARKRDGKPLVHGELRVLDCELELKLAELAYGRDHGQEQTLGDGSKARSKQWFRVNEAKRVLKAAEDALTRMQYMTGNMQPQTYVTPVDVRGYFDVRVHMEQVLASHGVKK